MNNACFLLIVVLFSSCQNSSPPPIEQERSENVQLVESIDFEILRDTSVHFLWRENVYDDEIQDSVNSIVINESYVKIISPSEKAALAYVSTFIGNDCWWDGAMNEERSNLKCTILTALNLGYQCSDGHLGLIRKWFSRDKTVLNEIVNCPTIPYTSTMQNTFEAIDIKRMQDTLEIFFAVTQMNMREGINTKYTENNIFKVNQNGLNLISKEMSEFVKSKMTIGVE